MATPLDTTGLDRALLEDFNAKEDVRSYIASKYGHEYVERVVRAIERCGLCGQDHEACTCTD